MAESDTRKLRFADQIDVVKAAVGDGVEVQILWASGRSRAVDRVRDLATACLGVPLDFPPIASAIVPGDKVALAVDPSVPDVDEVVAGISDAILAAGAGHVAVVLWDEATDAMVENLRSRLSACGSPSDGQDSERVSIDRHVGGDRDSLRYVAADDLADPVYLNRRIVDADFVLPVVVRRDDDPLGDHAVAGVFPVLADSATRRAADRACADGREGLRIPQIHWLLGIQVLVQVRADDAGNAAAMIAGTPEALARQGVDTPVVAACASGRDTFDLVIASIDAATEQQSWANIARAAVAASSFTAPGGTVVVWAPAAESISPGIRSALIQAIDADDPQSTGDDFPADPSEDHRDPTSGESDSRRGDQDGFPNYDLVTPVSRVLGRVAADHRVVLLTESLDPSELESTGLASIDSAEQLGRLVAGARSVGVLPTAHLAAAADPGRAKDGTDAEASC